MSNFSQGQGQICRTADLDSYQAARKGEGNGCPESNQGITRPAPRREQVVPQIDPGEICAAFHGAGAEIEEKGHFWMETNYSE
jgi:hypothetical protein